MSEVRMAKKKGRAKSKPKTSVVQMIDGYDDVLAGVVDLLESTRRAAARPVNAIMTATYWEIGRRLFVHEQSGKKRAGYGDALIEQLSRDLSKRFGRGFGRTNLFQMRAFFVAYAEIVQTASGQFAGGSRARKVRTASG